MVLIDFKKIKKIITNSYDLKALEQLTMHRVFKSFLIIILLLMSFLLCKNVPPSIKSIINSEYNTSFINKEVSWMLLEVCRGNLERKTLYSGDSELANKRKKILDRTCKTIEPVINKISSTKLNFTDEQQEQLVDLLWRNRSLKSKMRCFFKASAKISLHLLTVLAQSLIFIVSSVAFYFWLILYIFIGNKYKE